MNRVLPLIFAMAALLACDDGTNHPGERTAGTPPASSKADDPTDVGDRDTFVGVLPDFSPSHGVYVHRLLRELSPKLLASLIDELGSERVIELTTGYAGPSSGFSRATSLVWTRDFLPLSIGAPEGITVVSYLSVDPTRSGYDGSIYVPMQAPSPAHRFFRVPGQDSEWRLTETMPLLNEGGNVVATGRWIVATDKVLRDNADAPKEGSVAALRRSGWEARSTDETLAILSKATRTPTDRIIVLPPMPGEKTDHADLVVMALGPNEVMVPEVRDDILNIITFGHEIELGWRVREYLDEVAATLEERGLKVHRLPMLPPVYLGENDGEPTGYHGVFYSPTNATQVHIAGETPRVWLPTFDAEGFPESYVAVKHAYEDTWVDFFEARGFVALPVDATELGHAFGLFHCVTAPAF